MSTLTVKELSAPTGEVIKIAAGKTLDLNSQGTLILPTVPSAKMPTGSVLQVVNATNTNTANGGFLHTTTSSSYSAVALSAAITPSSTSSKIMVFINTSYYRGGASSWTIYGGGTNLGGSTHGMLRVTGGESYWYPISLSTLHSPNTTSAITYQLYSRAESGTTYTGGDGDVVSTITLMEIQG